MALMERARPLFDRSPSWWLAVQLAATRPIRETTMPRPATRPRSAAALLVRWTRPIWRLLGSPSKSGLTEMSRKRSTFDLLRQTPWRLTDGARPGGVRWLGRERGFDEGPPGRDLVPALEVKAGRRVGGV